MSTNGEKNARQWIVAGLALVAITWLVYWPVLRCEFLQFDDPDYVTENEWVKRGLTGPGIVQAFCDTQSGNWHPLTWLSHMLDAQLFGMRPAGHHLTSLLLHGINAALLLLVLRQLTGAFWRSALVAGLFALHPLRVESVAWVSERKDVLSGCFFLLTLWAYVRYAKGQRGKGAEGKPPTGVCMPPFSLSPFLPFYFLALFFFACGLMSKAMVVTLPFVLLLLDYWPLRRVAGIRLLLEKLPFFALTAAGCMMAYHAQGKGGSITDMSALPLDTRAANALAAAFVYVRKTFWPSDLAVFYPYTGGPTLPKLVLLTAFLIGVTVVAVRLTRSRPYLAVGWFWFLGMLVPVIGLVQIGLQSMADRYTYLPAIGLFVAVVWAAADGIRRFRRARGIALALGVAALAGCAWVTRLQLPYWENGVALFTRALAVTPNNALAQYSLGAALAARGKTEEACERFFAAVELNPGHPEALNNAGLCLVMEGETDAGMDCYRRALAIKPDYPEARYNLGLALAARGDWAGAIEQYREAIRVKPAFADAHEKLGLAYVRADKHDEAATHFNIALHLRPDAMSRRNFGSALILMNDPAGAVEQYREALRLRPDWPDALNLLAWLLASHGKPEIRDGAEAVRLAERACALTSRTNFTYLTTLAAAYAEAGRFSEAAETSESSLELAVAARQYEFAEGERRRLELYRANRPFHQE